MPLSAGTRLGPYEVTGSLGAGAMISALNHPNVGTLHDVAPDFLVMELVAGESLEDLIAPGTRSIAAPTCGRSAARAIHLTSDA